MQIGWSKQVLLSGIESWPNCNSTASPFWDTTQRVYQQKTVRKHWEMHITHLQDKLAASIRHAPPRGGFLLRVVNRLTTWTSSRTGDSQVRMEKRLTTYI